MRPVRRFAAPVTALVLATALGLGACSAGDGDGESDSGTSSEEGADSDATENDDADDATGDDAADDAADGAGDPAGAEVVPLEGTFVTEVSVPAGVEYEVTTTASTLQLNFPAPADPAALSAFYQAWFTDQGMTGVTEISGIVTGTLGDASWTLVPQDAGSWMLSAATV